MTCYGEMSKHRHNASPHSPFLLVKTTMITRDSPQQTPAKILVCQQRQIGDVLLLTPSIRLLYQRFPQAEIHVLTEKKCTPVLENNPLVTKVWAIDKTEGLGGALSLYRQISGEGFDITIDFQQLIRLKLATLASGAKIRLSYTPKWYNRLFYNMTSPLRSGYAAKAKTGVLHVFGIRWDGERPEIHLTDKEMLWAKEFMAQFNVTSGVPFITLDPTHRRITRKWPAEHYAELVRMLLGAHPSLRFFILYGPGERDEVNTIREMVGNHERCLVAQHMTTLREMCAIQAIANGHIGNCSSPRHFAAAVGVPTLTILGSTKPGAWRFPDDIHRNIRRKELDCIACNSSKCANNTLSCLNGLTPERVFNAALDHFDIFKKA